MSWLSAFGKDIKKVFSFIASPKVQTVIKAGEGVVEDLIPSATAIINLANSWMTKVITTESIAAAAGSQTGSGTQKAAAVLAAMQPEIAQYFPAATTVEIQNANTAIVAFLNAFSTVTTSSAPFPAPPPAPPISIADVSRSATAVGN